MRWLYETLVVSFLYHWITFCLEIYTIAIYTLYIQYSAVVDERLREEGTLHVISYRGVLHLESNLVFQNQEVDSKVNVPFKVILLHSCYVFIH